MERAGSLKDGETRVSDWRDAIKAWRPASSSWSAAEDLGRAGAEETLALPGIANTAPPERQPASRADDVAQRSSSGEGSRRERAGANVGEAGNTAQPSGARCVVGASGAAAGWRRARCRARRIGGSYRATPVRSEPGPVTPAGRARPNGDAWSYGRQNSLMATLIRIVSASDRSRDVTRQPGPHPMTRTRPPRYAPRPEAQNRYRLPSSASYGSRLPDFARPRDTM